MHEVLEIKSRRIISGCLTLEHRAFTVVDGSLHIKPRGFGRGGWFATCTISGNPGYLSEIGAYGILEVEDERGCRWRAQGPCTEVCAEQSGLTEIVIDGKGLPERLPKPAVA